MPHVRRPSRAQVARAIAAWRILARPPDPERVTAALGVAPETAAEGEAEENRETSIRPGAIVSGEGER